MKPSYSWSFLHNDHSLINIENKVFLFKQILIIAHSVFMKGILWSPLCDKCGRE